MGKHKHDREYSKEELKQAKVIADRLEEYVNTGDMLIIPTGENVSTIEESEKIVRKAIKNLREGKLHKVFSDDEDDAISISDLKYDEEIDDY